RLVPDPDSFTVLPYSPHSAAMLVDMLTADRTPWAACPRSFLKRMRSRAAERGLQLSAAFEAEFSLATRDQEGRYVPFDRSLCFSSIGMTEAARFVDALVGALAAQNLTVEQYYPDYGPAQH